MPLTRGAIKKLRQDKKKTIINRLIKKRVKDTVSKFKLAPSIKSLSLVFSMLDTAKKKKIYSPNKVARLKSRLCKLMTGKKISKAPKTIKPKKKQPSKKQNISKNPQN